ncbi:SIS domain-containing protein [Rhizobium sp. AG207R]|uniref:SIS domain-containing protein n=1 Tax=Rhizobium sp. AG207R TaxID=2802287 RepID=UPI0022AC775E|nr:SIS domain-containing protein [Rhizobium sp. AG207R]MCZ3378156.1 SIS domain-containing protein [Rhizobium sp. AG207R]
MQLEEDWLGRAKQVIGANAAAILATLEGLNDTFIVVARKFIECKGKILVTGSGTSGAIASRAAHLLSVGGTPAFYLPPGDGLHGGLGVLQKDDLVLALSKGGSSGELNDFCARAKSLCSGLVSITADPKSTLAQLSDDVILLTLPADSDLGAVVATGSSLAAAAVTDALVEVCRVGRGYGWDKLLFTHPSGAVGRDAEKSLERLQTAEG